MYQLCDIIQVIKNIKHNSINCFEIFLNYHMIHDKGKFESLLNWTSINVEYITNKRILKKKSSNSYIYRLLNMCKNKLWMISYNINW